MSNTGWFDSKDRKTGQNYKIKTRAHTDYDIIGKYNQFDTAIVLQVIRNEKDIGIISKTGNIDSEIGSILCRPINKNSPGNLKAYPINSNINQYPAEGEYVRIGTFGGDTEQIFYELISPTGTVNYNGNLNRLVYENKKGIQFQPKQEEYIIDNSTAFKIKTQYKLRPLSSDLILQSRFGSNIRMTDMSAKLDSVNAAPTLIISNNILPTYGYTIEENANSNGSYVILTSGADHPEFVSSVYAEFVKNANSKTPLAYQSPTSYREFPTVNRMDGGWTQDPLLTNTNDINHSFVGNRIIISSDAIINQSISGNIYHLATGNLVLYSKRSTSIDATRGMNINTYNSSFRLKANSAYINSPNIFLGMEEDRTQPALLGENLLTFLELIIGSLKQYIDLTQIFDDATYIAPGKAEAANNLKNALRGILSTGRIPEDFRRSLLSDKVFISPNRFDPQVDFPAVNQSSATN